MAQQMKEDNTGNYKDTSRKLGGTDNLISGKYSKTHKIKIHKSAWEKKKDSGDEKSVQANKQTPK